MQIKSVLTGLGTMAVLISAGGAPVANAQPGCTASGLSSALSTVASGTAAWLTAHPEADQVITDAGGQGPAGENSIRQYFVAHPDQWAQLQGIARPLTNLRQSCNVQVAPGDIARLYDAMAS